MDFDSLAGYCRNETSFHWRTDKLVFLQCLFNLSNLIKSDTIVDWNLIGVLFYFKILYTNMQNCIDAPEKASLRYQ